MREGGSPGVHRILASLVSGSAPAAFTLFSGTTALALTQSGAPWARWGIVLLTATLGAACGLVACSLQRVRREHKHLTREVRSHATLIDLSNQQLEVDRAQCETQQDALERANRELRATLSQLRRAASEAQSANRTKSAFLASVSHEIRTPLTSILGYVELLGEGCPGVCAFGKEHARSHIETITRNAEHLLHLINDILDFSKIEAGRLDIERFPCSVAATVAEVQDLIRVRAESNETTLHVCYEGLIPEKVNTDPTRLRQILLNLMENAIKFTPAGEVRLVVRLNETGLDGDPCMEFDVRDTGIGMTPEQMRGVFRPFTQADNSMSRRFGGTGLGLAISRRLAELLGGTITAQSTPGHGSVFQVKIATGSLDGIAMIDGCHPVTEPVEHAEEPTRDAAQRTLQGRVLLAEDSPDNQRLIGFILRKVGLDTVLVDDGQQAVDAAWEAHESGRPFDVILMDMQMPVLDGYTATQQLRGRGYAGPIIAFTAHAMSGDRDQCIAAGCDDHVSKPINRPKLIATIQRHLQDAPAESAPAK